MTSKLFSTHSRALYLAAALMLTLVSCAPRGIAPSPDTARRPVLPAPEHNFPAEPGEMQQQPVPETANPRTVASLQLTRQARSLIETRQADRAIRVLEQAVAIDPSNGRNYYYLSEAWLIKGDMEQAANFNELASIHLDSDAEWQRRITDQKRRIRSRSHQNS